ncbi:MAG: GldG family protein [Oscillospiraceae bacterium]|nr:GldG family protein [Oscillospiraceae bacterium]MBQ5336429.1 GldG family protein [Oscillospiraceae bacterium]
MAMKKGMKVNTIAWIAAAAVLAVAVPLNLIFTKADKSIDVTPFSAYSLSDSAVTTLSNLEKPVNMTVLYDMDLLYEGSEPGEAEYMMADMFVKTMRQMEKYDKINLTEIDVITEPEKVEKLDPDNLMNLSAGDIVLECNGRKRSIQFMTLFKTNEKTGSVEFYGENAILGAISYLQSGITPTVYFTTGHDEAKPDTCTNFVGAITSNNYEVKTLDLAAEKKIPEDALTVVMAAPQKDLSSEEKNILLDYAAGGGNISMFLSPVATKTAFVNIEAVLATYQVEMNYNRIYETNSANCWKDDRYSILCQFEDNDFTSALKNLQPTLYMPNSRSFYSTQSADENEETTTVKQEFLVSTIFDESTAIQYTAFDEIYGGNRSDADYKSPGGQYLIALNASDSARNGSKLFLSGSYDFLRDDFNTEVAEAGAATLGPYLFLSAVSWMDKINSSDAFPTRVSATDYITIPDKKTGNIILVIMIALPVLIAASGVIVWARRHNA